MFSQTNLTTRRQFLERSMLGFGSAFLLPSLLTSCTDHIIDPVIPPSTNPPLLGGDVELFWYDTARNLIINGFEQIPEIGDILGPLIGLFWPANKPDLWDQIRNEVQELINKSIADFDYNLVYEDLQGLNNNITIYLDYVNSGTPSEILTQWIVTRSQFLNALPHFQSKGNELLLLPLFAQFANMYLSLLRDPLLPSKDNSSILTGKTWGMTDGDIQNITTALQKNITDFYTYTAKTYNDNRLTLFNSIPIDNTKCEPFRTTNIYDRQMTQTVLNFMDTWPYYDATKYPEKTTVMSTREIYSDPYGATLRSGVIGIVDGSPKQRPTTVSVWSTTDTIHAVQVTYPTDSGPGGLTQTPIMGAGGGNRRDFALTQDNPIIAGRAIADISFGEVMGLQFLYADGTHSDFIGGTKGVYPNSDMIDSGDVGFNYEYVSSIHINGYEGSPTNGVADSIVFGFQFWNPPAATLQAIQAIYVKSPKEKSADDFAKAFPKLAIAANFITDELKLARKAYWAYIHARAKALK